MASQTTIASPTTTTDAAADRPENWPTSKPWLLDPRPRISVMVVDGQAVFRSGLARLLGEDDRLEVVAVSEGGPEVPELCAAMSIDVVVTDLRLPEDGRDRADPDDLRRLAGHQDLGGGIGRRTGGWSPPSVRARRGSSSKTPSPKRSCRPWSLCTSASRCCVGEAISWVNGKASVRRLTRRETEVLAMMAEGVGNKEIAERLNLGEKTVRNYVSRVYRKLAVHSRAQIAAYASHVRRLEATSAPTAALGRPWGDSRPGRGSLSEQPST